MDYDLKKANERIAELENKIKESVTLALKVRRLDELELFKRWGIKKVRGCHLKANPNINPEGVLESYSNAWYTHEEYVKFLKKD